MGPKLRANLSKTAYGNWLGISVHSDEFTEIEGLKSKTLIYLTADSDEVLEELNPECAYIIGGIVDRNRLKGITARKAEELKIKTARLPIKENLSFALRASQVTKATAMNICFSPIEYSTYVLLNQTFL